MSDNNLENNYETVIEPVLPVSEQISSLPESNSQSKEEIDEVVGNRPLEEVNEKFKCFENLKGDYNPNEATLYLTMTNRKTLDNQLNNLPKGYEPDRTGQNYDWIQSLQKGTLSLPVNNVFFRNLTNSDSNWEQHIPSPKGGLGISSPRLDDNNGEAVTAQRAVMRFRAMTNQGRPLTVPLWHSGFWVTLRTPPNREILNFYQTLTQETINLGRSTYGLIYSNTKVYQSFHLINFIKDIIYDTSLQVDKNIFDNILITDLNTLAWSLSCLIYPHGFQFSRACSANPEQCNHILYQKINPVKLVHTDNNVLTDWQRNHMTQRGGSTMSSDSIKRYKEEFNFSHGRNIELMIGGSKVTIELKIPTINEYITAGTSWVDGIVNNVNSLLLNEEDKNKRDVLYNSQAAATSLKQYSHFYKQISTSKANSDLPSDTVINKDFEAIEGILETLSEDEDNKKKIISETLKFIEDCTFSIIAIPNVTCPNCKEPIAEKNDKYEEYIPIDPMYVFFTLLMSKITGISQMGLE